MSTAYPTASISENHLSWVAKVIRNLWCKLKTSTSDQNHELLM